MNSRISGLALIGICLLVSGCLPYCNGFNLPVAMQDFCESKGYEESIRVNDALRYCVRYVNGTAEKYEYGYYEMKAWCNKHE